MEKRNLLLTLCFHGAFFHGSAIQRNAATVQGTLQPALERIAGEPLQLKCCSRTDTGVHARMFCISFRTNSTISCNQLLLALNAELPDAIAPIGCREAPLDFHARYSCRGKRYAYRILNRPLRDPFDGGMSWRIPRPLDTERMDKAASGFIGTYDFSAFCASGGGTEDRVRTITASAVCREGDRIRFDVAGNGFLYHMVRIMTGTLVAVAQGKIEPDLIPVILASRDRKRAGITAPACGLYLEEVYY